MGKNSDKLKNEEKARKYYGQKLRTERSDNKAQTDPQSSAKTKRSQKMSMDFKKEQEKVAKQAVPHRSSGDVAVVLDAASGFKDAKEGDNNTDVTRNVIDLSKYGVKKSSSSIKQKLQNKLYGRKLGPKERTSDGKNSKNKNCATESQQGTRAQQRRFMKNEQNRQRLQHATEKVKELGKAAIEFVADFIETHPMTAIAVVVALILFLAISGLFTGCSAMGSGSEDVMVITTYTAEDEDILGAEEDYQNLEEELQETLDNIETDKPGYDEYVFTLDEIGHNPYQLAAILTIIYEDYTREEVQGKLQEIFELQYDLETEEVVETREREVEKTGSRWVDDDSYDEGGYYEDYTYTETEEYDYYILYVTLTNHTLNQVVEELGFTDDQMARYQVLLITYGNKPYLFGEDDIYNISVPGELEDYDVPSEYLTDEQFARMYREIEKYIGMEYVWGGSNPSTGFDCSGFVSWVINNSGNGWNVGRQTANGLKHIATSIPASEVHAGDLIFFQGTYNTSGASHVGIVVDPVNHIMAHAGNPIKYSSYDTSYWQGHAYGYGRLP